ncbi:MAG: hypothetical protein RR483_06290, partial [Clostridia bacterium]
MKKLISGFLTVIMITCFISITAFAENVVVECKKTELKETNQIKVEAIISENAGINTAAMNVVYDNKALEISQKEDEGVIQGDYVSQGGIFIGNPKADENKVSVTYASVTQTKKKAALFSVVFNVLDQSLLEIKDKIKDKKIIIKEALANGRILSNQYLNYSALQNETAKLATKYKVTIDA